MHASHEKHTKQKPMALNAHTAPFHVDKKSFAVFYMDNENMIASDCINPRDLNFDKPARTLTCRNLSGATGDMQRIKMPDGRRKRVNIREAARLQSFPDWFDFGERKVTTRPVPYQKPPKPRLISSRRASRADDDDEIRGW